MKEFFDYTILNFFMAWFIVVLILVIIFVPIVLLIHGVPNFNWVKGFH